MAFKQDWILRQIDMIIEFVSRLLTGGGAARHGADDLTELSPMGRRLSELLAQGEICAAEDLLFERLDAGKPEDLRAAVEFYRRLNALSDDELEAGGFSRDEVAEGLRNALDKFGILLPEGF